MSDRQRLRTSQAGFTLLEVMVAVAIFAGIAITISDTASMRVNNLLTMRTMTMASFVAENRLTDIRLTGIPPQPGETNDIVEMAGQEWHLLTEVTKTQFPGLVRIDVAVAPEITPDNPVINLSTIMGPN
ncbi:MAG: type II secretion system minor pseudopilin GspI [Thalassolituus sp.]|jgi:general secretion pathway protein I|uniref:type II secretion system minor pseudopilin GspI n=1 Tax=unclassified Thalassolituus TaxID=2624967 RepID=UPI000C10DC88|nr:MULTISPECIES: type II secretion system minor pseudopilin GspI [unclassified Thalassolituus]MBN58529.1 type II secretion system protein GspI [Oceanospirillaceae bacterium]MDQ4422312.1 type II secretion system minor pseudopilin GspI [Thalassolituus sp.]MDQ4427344.1 type II secretion system minor pseudopilin GspI [Thalassolituus sp.]|tara:strand:+ start:685 stop:1071 length:387 start_codon:yes stop_codon:yes gene_type:complete